MDSTAFLVVYPEFSTVDPAFITAALAEVLLGMDPSVYGTRIDSAQGALTAHQIFMSPSGLSLRGDTKQSDTSDYMEKFKRIRREVTIGFLVAT